jgi:hypothetical protein
MTDRCWHDEAKRGERSASSANLELCSLIPAATLRARMLAAIAVLLSCPSIAFQPPNLETRHAAVGDLSGLPASLQKAFGPDGAEFDPIPTPGPHDWLAVHDEPGQTFDDFKQAGPNRPAKDRCVISIAKKAAASNGSPSAPASADCGSNHLAESDRRPLHLCPVCLRKLQWNIGFDVLKRYTELERANRAAGFLDEADWLSRRIQALRLPSGSSR